MREGKREEKRNIDLEFKLFNWTHIPSQKQKQTNKKKNIALQEKLNVYASVCVCSLMSEMTGI